MIFNAENKFHPTTSQAQKIIVHPKIKPIIVQPKMIVQTKMKVQTNGK